MRILGKYILKECVIPFTISLGVLTFVFLLGYLPQLADKVINKGVSLAAVTLVFLYNIPVLLTYTLPIAALSSVILTFGRMSSENEILAMRASGISLRRLLVPLITLGAIFSIVLLILNNRTIPRASHAQRVLLHETGAKNPAAALEAGTFVDDFEGYVLFIYKIDRNRLYNIRIYQPQPDGKPTRTIIAQEGEFTPVPNKPQVMLKLINGTSDEPDFHNPNNFFKLNFRQSFMTLDMARKTGKVDKKPNGMTLNELKEGITNYQKLNIDTAPLVAEYHRKLAWSLTPLLFILIGFPAAVFTHRRQKTANLLLAILFAGPYYLLSYGCLALASQGSGNPAVLMWVPNIIGGIIVLFLNWKLCAS